MSKKSLFDTIRSDELTELLGLKQQASLYKYKYLYSEETDFNTNITKPKIYFAAPWFDDKAREIMNTYMNIYDYCEENCCYNVFFPFKQQEKDSPLEVFNNNVKQIRESSILVALVSRKDVGTAFEIGVAYKSNIPIVLAGLDYSDFESKTNVMLAFCAKYCITIDGWIDLLYNNISNSQQYVISNGWEGKE